MNNDEKRIIMSTLLDFFKTETESGFTDAENNAIDVAIGLLDSAFHLTECGLQSKNKDDISQKLKEYDKNLDENAPHYAEYYNSRGHLARHDQKFKDAVVYYTKAHRAYPSRGMYLSYRATAFLKMGCFDIVVEDCKEALNNYEDRNTYESLAMANVALEQWEEAVDAFKNALRYAPTSLSLYYGYNRALHEMVASEATKNAITNNEPCQIIQCIKVDLKKSSIVMSTLSCTVNRTKAEPGKKCESVAGPDSHESDEF